MHHLACKLTLFEAHALLLLAGFGVSEIQEPTCLLSGRPLQGWWMVTAAKMAQPLASGGLQGLAVCTQCLCNVAWLAGCTRLRPLPPCAGVLQCVSGLSCLPGPVSTFCTRLMYNLLLGVLPCAVPCPNSRKSQCCAAGEQCQWTFDRTSFAWERVCCKKGGWT